MIQHVTASRLSQSSGKRGVRGQTLERLRERGGSRGGHEQSGFAVHDDVGDAAQIAGDHWHTVCHGLEQHDT
jgi:hypothetical protein